MRLVSFDIFDTTLIRRCGAPQLVFELLAHKLYPHDMAAREAFVHWRRNAKGDTLAEIYSPDIEKDFPEYTAEQLMQTELDTEAEMLTTNPAVLDLINEWRTKGATIKFVSDMYLPSAFLAEVLTREGCMQPGDEVIVSCEWHARKDTGTLYDKIREKYLPAAWHHYGDNLRSDIKMARKYGIKATRIDTSFTEVERKLMDDSKRLHKGWQLRLLVGASRAARLMAHNTPESILAADYVVPTYLPFVKFVIDQSKARGIKRLHFLSRDGYIMQKIAEAIAPASGIEYNYLFVSRRSLIPAFLLGKESDSTPAERFMDIVDKRTLLRKKVDSMLKMLSIGKAELKSHNIEFNFSKITTTAQELEFLDKIFNNPDFSPVLLEKWAKQAELANGYFRQEGLFDDGNAYVDVGWLGTSRLMLSAITGRSDGMEGTVGLRPADANKKGSLTFYMGVRGDVYPRRYGDYLPYFRAGQLDTAATALIESYFSASPWPTTIGYKHIGDKYEPIFPDGKTYSESVAVSANTEIAEYMCHIISDYNIGDDILRYWSQQSLQWLSDMKSNVSLAPMAQSAGIDDAPLVSKLGIAGMIKYVLLGDHVTDFDRGSLAYTVGWRMMRILSPVAAFTGRLRNRLFRLLVKRI